MDNVTLQNFIFTGLKKWKQIKLDFSNNKEMSVFLNRAYPVIMFDHYQLNMELAKNLYRLICSDEKKATLEERQREAFRQKMVSYFENDLQELFLEMRFLWLKIEFIQELKHHPAIRELNHIDQANINIIIL